MSHHTSPSKRWLPADIGVRPRFDPRPPPTTGAATNNATTAPEERVVGNKIGVAGQLVRDNTGAVVFLLIAILVLLVTLFLCIRQWFAGKEEEEVEEEKKEPVVISEISSGSGSSEDTTVSSKASIVDDVEQGHATTFSESSDGVEVVASFVDADDANLGQIHTTMNVHHCKSGYCTACREGNITFVNTYPDGVVRGSASAGGGGEDSVADNNKIEPTDKRRYCTVTEEMVAKYVQQQHPTLVGQDLVFAKEEEEEMEMEGDEQAAQSLDVITYDDDEEDDDVPLVPADDTRREGSRVRFRVGAGGGSRLEEEEAEESTMGDDLPQAGTDLSKILSGEAGESSQSHGGEDDDNDKEDDDDEDAWAEHSGRREEIICVGSI